MRLLHFSDAHLDVPHSRADLESAQLRRAELRAAFSSMMTYVRQNDVRVVLCSGDLFDHAFLTRETTALLREEFASVPSCHFVIAPGNRDYYAQDSVYATTVFSDNVHIFRSPRPTCFPLDDIGVQVWGFAHCSPDMGEWAPLAGLQLAPKPEGMLRLFCGHAALAGEKTESHPSSESGTPPTVTKEQLAACGFDYAALGHAHTSDGIRRVGTQDGAGGVRWTYFGYAGCLVGRGFDECGAKGAVSGTFSEATDENGKPTTAFSVRRLRIARRHYERLDADFSHKDVNGHADIRAVLREARAAAEKTGTRFDADASVRVLLHGALLPGLTVTKDDVRAVLPEIASTEILDETTAAPDFNLKSDATLRGAYYRALLDACNDGDADARSVATEALRAGFSALREQGS